MANDLDQKIIRQIEYYFGDYNLPKDKFLQEKIGEDEGWVTLEVLLTFKRLASITTDSEVIVKAIETSDSGLLEVSEDHKKIRRSPEKPLPEFDEQKTMDRTAYAKGFPLDESLDNIMIFLEPHGPVESCKKRQYLDRATKEHKFKGSCFIVFKDVEGCKKFVEDESIKYKETELIRKFQKDYIEGKREEIKSRKDDRRKKKEEKAAAEVEIQPFPKGAIFYFTGIKDGVKLYREEIKEKIGEIVGTPPSYIDYNLGDSEGYVRMAEENDAVEFYKKITDGKFEVGESTIEVEVLEGEKEDEYFQKAKELMARRRTFNRRGKRNNNRRDGPPMKRSKV